jgi:hypothetical protein
MVAPLEPKEKVMKELRRPVYGKWVEGAANSFPFNSLISCIKN